MGFLTRSGWNNNNHIAFVHQLSSSFNLARRRYSTSTSSLSTNPNINNNRNCGALVLKMVKDVTIIVAAAASNRGIGYQGQLPWKLPGDMQHFKQVTTTISSNENNCNAVIMGRKTWESIPSKFRPLPGRLNVVLTRQDPEMFESNNDNKNDVLIVSSLDEAWTKLDAIPNIENVFVIGGAQIYNEALQSDKEIVKSIVYTEVGNIPESMEFDAFFPELLDTEWDCQPYRATTSIKEKENGDEWNVDTTSGLSYRFLEYTRRTKAPQSPTSVVVGIDVAINNNDNSVVNNGFSSTTAKVEEQEEVNEEEMQYLNLCRDILENGIQRGDRTGTGTLSKFGTQMRFSLRDGTMPLLTTKRTFWRGVAEELLWFISGNTNANVLAEKDIHIWDGNGSREFLDSRGLQHREVGDLGPVYGFQWRHFGAKYDTMHTDYTGKGIDQLADCINKIINNPEDRRIIMSAWNPADLHDMALPPCHMFCQFYVDTVANEVSCQMYQRSADLGLGVPFNIASYALLTHLIAYVTGRKPGDFVHTIGDAHIYLNHVEALQEQLQRTPRPFPKLKINPKKPNPTIDDFTMDDFELIGYKPYGPIKMKMAV